mgnify:CR=1 FL=1
MVRELGHQSTSYEDIVGSGVEQKSLSGMKVESARDYACEDADVTFQLFK